MKTIILVVLMGISNCGFALENANIYGTGDKDDTAFSGYLADETGLSYDKVFTYDLGDKGISKASAIITYTSSTYLTQTFTDGRTSSGTITVLSTASLKGTRISVNGIYFSYGLSFIPTDKIISVGATVDASAHNLITAITANVATTKVTATHSTGVCTIVSAAADGVGYAITTSKPAVVSIGGNMGLGVLTKVSPASDSIYILGHGYSTGAKVVYTGAVAIGGLTSGGTYYVVKVDANYFRLASSLAYAKAGSYIDITAIATDATETTYTITPGAIAGAPAFFWQVSNDGSTFMALPSSGSVTMAYVAGGTTIMKDFGDVNYRYLSLNVTGPTAGGVLLKSAMYFKRN